MDLGLRTEGDDQSWIEKPIAGLHESYAHAEVLLAQLQEDNYYGGRPRNVQTVRGVERYGILVDPGASNGLIGTDTLLTYMRACL